MRSYTILLSALMLAVVIVSAPVHAAKRVALIVGNSNYENVEKLKNPANDAKALARKLKSIGFDDVTLELDLKSADLRRALGRFAKTAAGADIAMLYFAGHGIEVSGTNYVIPIDARLSHVDDVDFEAVELSKIMRALNRASKLKLVVLDACRNNPFKAGMDGAGGNRSIGRGLSRVTPSGGKTLVAYAAKEGTVAADGKGQHSPYAKALLKHISTPGLDVRILFGRVHDEVLKTTGRKQEPFTYGALGGIHIYLVPPAGTPASNPAPQGSASIDRDALFWSSVKDSRSPRILQTYLNTFPSGQFSELARIKIEELKNARHAKLSTAESSNPALKPPKLTRIPTTRPRRGDAFSHFVAGNREARAKNYEAAMQRWSEAAHLGHADSAYKIGALFESGRGRTKDLHSAGQWYETAKKLGSTRASKALKRLSGVRPAKAGTAQRLTKLTKSQSSRLSNSSSATASLRRAQKLYFQGNAAARRRDGRRARDSWTKAAELGHHDAAFKLGAAYQRGKVFQRNLGLARQWYSKAQKLGSARAAKALKRLDKSR